MIDRSFLKRIVEDDVEGAHVSIYLPTHEAGREIRQDPIRLKNLLNVATTALEKSGLGRADIESLLAPAARLVPNAGFWRRRSPGLVLFLVSGRWVVHDLPFACEELAVVGRRFHVAPLVQLLHAGYRFFVLALSQNGSRLLDCGSWGGKEMPVDLPGLEAILADEVVERQLQFHTGTTGTVAGERRAASFHGHGAGQDARDHRLERFLRETDRRVCDALYHSADREPLVVAAVEELQAAYRSISQYTELIAGGLPGNPEHRSPDDLAQDGSRLVAPILGSLRRRRLDRYLELVGKENGRTTAELGTIVSSARHGRVEELFFAKGARRWGRYEPARDRIELTDGSHPDDEELIDLAVALTVTRGGEVWALAPSEMPVGAEAAAAVLRF